MALRPSSVPLRVPLPSPPASSLANGPYPESDLVCAASPTVTRLLATIIIDPLFESAAASALVAELVDFSTVCHLDYTAESEQEDFECLAAAVTHLVAMLLAPEGDLDAPDIRTPCSYAEAIEGPYSSQWQIAMDAEMASWMVKRPPGSPPVFKTRYVTRGFSKRQGVDFFQTFSPTPKMTTLRVLLHVAAQRDYELHSLDFSTAFSQGSLHEEIWLRGPPGFTGSFPAGPQWSLQRPVYGLRQAPREWHETPRTMLAALGFAPSTADPSLFLRTVTSLPLFYVLVYVDDFVFAIADTEALALVKSELHKRHTCTDLGRGPVVLTGHADASWVDDLAMQRSSQGYTFSLSSCSVSWRSTRSSFVLSSSCEAEIYAGAMAAQELRWLTYLLTDLGERPRSPPVLYVDNKAMIALCQEHRLEHRMKHIALRYFLARELQHRGQLCLAYMASRANTADVFGKALQPVVTLVAAPAAPVKALVATTNGAHLVLIVAAPLIGPLAPLPAAPSCTFVPLRRGPERLQQRSLRGEVVGVASGSLQALIVSPLTLSRGATRHPLRLPQWGKGEGVWVAGKASSRPSTFHYLLSLSLPHFLRWGGRRGRLRGWGEVNCSLSTPPPLLTLAAASPLLLSSLQQPPLDSSSPHSSSHLSTPPCLR
ncbi:unnamed protein product [Closterium sp. NIES-54]